jgi:hypothetical protein
MEKELYTALKAEIQSKIPRIKTVGLFNNQFTHSNGEQKEGRDQNPFLYPACYIQFDYGSATFQDYSQGVQHIDSVNVITHLGFESYKNEDLEILQIKQDLFKVIHRFRNEYFAALTRISEEADYNHSNIQVYKTIYRTSGKDFTADIRPTIAIPSGTTISVSAVTVNLSAITS